MLRNCALLVVLFGTAFCNVHDVGGFGGVVEDTDNSIPPEFHRALKMAFFDKKVVDIVRTTKQIVQGVKYTVDFNAAPHNCFIGEKYIEGNCRSGKESCSISYFLQPWKKVDLTLSSDNNDNICQSNRIDPELKENSFNSTVDGFARKLFDKFITKYKRTYRPDANNGKYWQRFSVFKKNLKLAHSFNMKEQGTAQYGITKFMDYTLSEYKKYLAPGFMKGVEPPKLIDVAPAAIPDSFDWTEHGAVTEVKNQGQCGSCWAFSTTGNVEGQWFLKKGQLVSLSEQELVDCDKVDQGCNGGLPSNAYLSIEKLGGLEKENDYSYDARGEKCTFKKSKIAAYINSSIALPTDESKLATWMSKNGPISIGINANAMMLYMGGISHPYKITCNPANLDHGVLIVGYGVEAGTKFWKIKNSWGPDWGEKGYYRIFRGDGSCGVNRMATSSIVD